MTNYNHANIPMLLESRIKPMNETPNSEAIGSFIKEKIKSCDELLIAVGFITQKSVDEINILVHDAGISRIVLIAGMYSQDPLLSSVYRSCMRINEEWMRLGIGEIRFVKPFQYHGKIFLFKRDHVLTGGIIGSANLSVLKPDGYSLRTFETSYYLPGEAAEALLDQFNHLSSNKCSVNLNQADFLKVANDPNTQLDGVELVEKVTPGSVDFYKNHLTNIQFILPIKVPAFAQRFMDDGKHYTKSNINVAYARPRSKTKNRDWFETQMTVSTQIRRKPGYPEYKKPFFVITDDGYWFKAHTTSEGNKQFSAVGDELIVGRWIKGRLVAAGLVDPVNDTGDDIDRKGMITKEILDQFGADSLLFQKTSIKAVDSSPSVTQDQELDIWVISMIKAPEEEDK